jgi:hypothetical protein
MSVFRNMMVGLGVATVLVPATSMATRFECENRKGFSWWSDALRGPKATHTATMSYDDKTEVLWLKVGTPGAGSKLPVKQTLNPDGSGALVASREVSSSAHTTEEVLIIRRPKNRGTFDFVFMTDEGASTGPCHIIVDKKINLRGDDR